MGEKCKLTVEIIDEASEIYLLIRLKFVINHVGLLRFLWFSANKSLPKKTLFCMSRYFVKTGKFKPVLTMIEW